MLLNSKNHVHVLKKVNNILGSNGLNIRPKHLVENIEHITNGQKGPFIICCSNTFGTEREKKKKKS